MLVDDPPKKQPNPFVVAAMTAAATTLATKLVEWGIETIKKRVASKNEEASE